MSVHVQEKGSYELFETTKGHRILVLNGQEWFAWVEGQQGELLVRSDSDHQKDHTLQQGQFYLANFKDDPFYRDMPHLFMERDGRYQERILPNGLPSEQDHQKKIITTDESLDKGELEEYLKKPASARPGGKRRERRRKRKEGQTRSGGLPLESYDDLTVDEVTHRLHNLSGHEVQQLKAYEEEHKKRKTLQEAFDRRLQHVQ